MVKVSTKLGPTVIRQRRQVTPGAMCSLFPLLQHLLCNGCAQGVVQKAKLNAGLSSAVTNNAEYLGEWSMMTAVLNISDHVINVLQMLRDYAYEESHEGKTCRYPRIGDLYIYIYIKI